MSLKFRWVKRDNEPVALPGFVPATFDFELKKTDKVMFVFKIMPGFYGHYLFLSGVH